MYLFEEDFYDYKTAPVKGTDVVDATKTGMSFYDDFLSNDVRTLEYLKNKKNLTGSVVMMSPEEYFKECSSYGFLDSHPSIETLKQQRAADKKTLNHLKDVLTVYKKKFPMPMINKAQNGQEGLHRMMVIGDMFGWDHKVPVLIVDWADKQRAFEDQKRERKERIEYNIRQSVQEALRYKFTNIEELKDQIQWELDRRFKYNEDGIDVPVKFELTSNERTNCFIVSIGAASYEFDYDEVEFIEEEDDFEIDDFDLETSEDFLVRYFGDNWRETHPHLKDTFHIEESFNADNIKQMDKIIQYHWASETPGEGCIFIAPNGKFINIYPELDDHEDLCYWLEENGYRDNPEDGEWFVSEFGYVRCRNSMHLCFIEVPQKMTREQYSSLEQWLEEKVSSDELDIEAWSGEWKTYNLNNYFPEDIIKIIKRSYASGKLYEKLK